MRIGYACVPLCIPYRTNRTYKLSTFNHDIAFPIIKSNLEDLKSILEYNLLNNISFFRISSDIVPLASHNDFDFDWKKEFKSILNDIGDFITSNNIRVTMHPGQYTVLNSTKPEIIEKSIKDLLFHCEFLDCLNSDYSNTVTLHVGGVYDNKSESIKRFINTYNSLPSKIKNRLVIENDEKNYSLDDLFNIHSDTGLPIVFDNLHEECFLNKQLSHEELYNIFEKASSTWGDRTAKVHYSQQDLLRKKGSHSPTIRSAEFLDYYSVIKNFNIDIMQEVKDKNISVLKTNNLLNIGNVKDTSEVLEAEKELYKNFIISRGFDSLINIEESIKSNNLLMFYETIDKLIQSPTDPYGEKFVLESLFNELKSEFTTKEINYCNKLFIEKNIPSIKSYILKLANRYNNNKQYDYFFIY